MVGVVYGLGSTGEVSVVSLPSLQSDFPVQAFVPVQKAAAKQRPGRKSKAKAKAKAMDDENAPAHLSQ